jgi:hypothetical protein
VLALTMHLVGDRDLTAAGVTGLRNLHIRDPNPLPSAAR